MKFFEVKSPYYYALIAARNEEECVKLYEQVVTDIENRKEFIQCLYELSRNKVAQRSAKEINGEALQPIGMEETTKDIFTTIDKQKSCVLSIDSALV